MLAGWPRQGEALHRGCPQKIQINQLFFNFSDLAWGFGGKGGDEFVGGAGDD